MPETTNETRSLIDPDLRARIKARAASDGKTMKDWLAETIIAKLEDDIDAAEGSASLADAEGTISFQELLGMRRREPGQAHQVV